MITVNLEGYLSGENTKVAVTKLGQLVTAPLDFSTFYNATAGTDDTPVNIVTPQTNKRFVITALTIYANKNVTASTDATVTIYEATGPNATQGANDKTIFTQDIPQKQTVVLTGLNIIVTEGYWINGITNDDDVVFNVAGYFVDA